MVLEGDKKLKKGGKSWREEGKKGDGN